jgi:hypothetical protein
MSDELRDKIEKLPAWARQHIKHLTSLPSVLADEATSLRRKVGELESRNRRLSEQVEAMTELFRCAALGGSEGAKTVIDILDGYEIFPPPKENQEASV